MHSGISPAKLTSANRIQLFPIASRPEHFFIQPCCLNRFDLFQPQRRILPRSAIALSTYPLPTSYERVETRPSCWQGLACALCAFSTAPEMARPPSLRYASTDVVQNSHLQSPVATTIAVTIIYSGGSNNVANYSNSAAVHLHIWCRSRIPSETECNRRRFHSSRYRIRGMVLPSLWIYRARHDARRGRVSPGFYIRKNHTIYLPLIRHWRIDGRLSSILYTNDANTSN